MANARRITIEFLGKDKSLGKTADGIEGKTSKLGGKFKKFGKVAALGFAAAAAGSVVLGKKLIDAGERAGTSNARIEQINKSMGLFGKEADTVSGRLIKLAEATARQTGMDQNAIKETQAKLLTFKELAKSADDVGGAFDRATKVAVDMEAAGFGPASTTAVQLGKALNDPIKGVSALSRVGITFTDQEKEKIKTLVESGKATEAQSLVLKAMEKQVGGTAEATANGTDKMKVVFSQLAEKIGMKLTPVVDKLANWMVKKALPAFEKVSKVLDTYLGPVIEAVGGFIGKTLVPAIKDLIDRFTGAKDGTDKVGKAMKDAQPYIETVKAILKGLGVVFKKVLLPVMGKIADHALPLIGKALGAVGRVAQTMWNKAIQPVFKFMVRAIGETMIMWGKMLRALAKVPGFGWAKKAADSMENAGRKAVDLSDDIKKIPVAKQVKVTADTAQAHSALDVLVNRLKYAFVGGPARTVGSKVTISGARAHGGSVMRSRAYKVGENGEEWFTPNTNGRIVSNKDMVAAASYGSHAGGGITHVTLNVYGILDGRQGGRAVERVLNEWLRSQGRGLAVPK